jgi:hypothetical protein
VIDLGHPYGQWIVNALGDERDLVEHGLASGLVERDGV